MRLPILVWLAGFATVCLVSPKAYAPPVPFEPPHPPRLSEAIFSPDNKFVFVAFTEYVVLDVATGKKVSWARHLFSPFAFLPDGKRYVNADCDRQNRSTLTLHDLRTGEVLRTFAERPERVRALAVSPDGNLALTGHDDGSILSWDLATGKRSHDFDVKDREKSSTHAVRSLFFSPDGKQGYSNDQRSIAVWDVATGKQIAPTFEAYQKANGCSHLVMAHSADGRLAVSGCHLFDREQPLLRVWNLKTGRMAGSFRGHRDCYVGAAALTPDGKRAFSVANWPEEVLREWDVATGKQSWKRYPDKGYCGAVFSSDATLALIGYEDGTLSLLDLRTKKVLWKRGLRP